MHFTFTELAGAGVWQTNVALGSTIRTRAARIAIGPAFSRLSVVAGESSVWSQVRWCKCSNSSNSIGSSLKK